MDSPYRSADLDVLLSASRGDRRCSNVITACAPATRRSRWPLAALADISAVLFALSITAGGLVGIAAGVHACVMVSTMNSGTVVRTAEREPPRAPSPPPRPKIIVTSPPTAFDVPVLRAGMLAVTEPISHDPAVLRARARDLERAGLPVHLIDVKLPPWETPKIDPFQIHATPVSHGGRDIDGIEIGAVPRFSLLARAGFQQGDVVLSIDGYPAAGTAWTDHVFWNAERGGLAVVELVRDGRRVVLSLTWPPAPRG